MKTIDEKIGQAQRNAHQGELGRTLAMNKINEMKLALIQMKQNFKAEASDATSDKVSEEDIPVFTLAQKKSNLAQLEQKLNEIKDRIPKVMDLEVELGLDESI